VVKTYRVDLALPGDKRQEGDSRTPEGLFYSCREFDHSQFGGEAIILSYPNDEDAIRGLRDGLISRWEHDAILQAQARRVCPPQTTDLGSYIELHGSGTGGRLDWTLGCAALTDEEMEEVYEIGRQVRREHGRPIRIGIVHGF